MLAIGGQWDHARWEWEYIRFVVFSETRENKSLRWGQVVKERVLSKKLLEFNLIGFYYLHIGTKMGAPLWGALTLCYNCSFQVFSPAAEHCF